MEVIYTRQFEEQRKKYRFCFTCEQCCHFDEEQETCLHEFPSHMHRYHYYMCENPPKTILFCKDFDLA